MGSRLSAEMALIDPTSAASTSPPPPIITPPTAYSQPRANLHSLPPELKRMILTHLDRPSLLNMARVAYSLQIDIRPHIWREINLSVSAAQHAELWEAYVTEHNIPDASGSDTSLSDLHDTLDELRREFDRKRGCVIERLARTIIGRSSADTLRMVQSIVYRPAEGDCFEEFDLLRLVSPNLRSLTVGAPPDWGYVDILDLSGFGDTIFQTMGLTSRPLSFPALTHVNIGSGTITYAYFLPLLCTLAPNLTSLTAYVHRQYDLPTDLPPIQYRLSRPTQLRHLQIYLDFDAARDSIYPTSSFVDSDTFTSIFSVINWSHSVRRLCVKYKAQQHISLAEEYTLGAISRCGQLEDFEWGGTVWELPYGKVHPAYPSTAGDGDGEPGDGAWSIKRLIVSGGDRFLHNTPNLGSIFRNLEILHIDRMWDEQQLLHPLPSYDVAQLVHPELARWLKLCPRLHAINFFRRNSMGMCNETNLFPVFEPIELGGNMSMDVRSLTHRGSEVLILRCLLEAAQERHTRQRGVQPPPPKPDHECQQRLFANSVGGAGRKPPAQRQAFTEFDGMAVPLEVLEQMRVVEGASEEKWDRRGVEVSGEAWEILQQWAGMAK